MSPTIQRDVSADIEAGRREGEPQPTGGGHA